jgi:hypothetical protein
MMHTITYNPRDNIIEVYVQGDLTLQRIKEIVSEVLKACKEQNCLFILSDFREAVVKLSTMEIYELPKVLSEMAVSSGLVVYKLRRAFVAQKRLDDLEFFETVTANKGQNMKLFHDIDDAKEWLSR